VGCSAILCYAVLCYAVLCYAPLRTDAFTLRFTSDALNNNYPGFVGALAPLCPRGRFSATGQPVEGACPGLCDAGYSCGPGATKGLGAQCQPGRYSPVGVGVCAPCPAGLYSGIIGSAACTLPCSAGYACPEGSTNGTVLLCPAGQYSLVGQGVCSPCPGGTYGSTAGLSSSACSGVCPAGSYCPAGITSPGLLCPHGQYR
jgi:hypothetical protein